ncbi:MAG: hypothetical protein M0Q21_02995 [Ignavibacteriaceae bacterium]|nr:hypothetical protein [Ignavibacteriaceae bacterium]
MQTKKIHLDFVRLRISLREIYSKYILNVPVSTELKEMIALLEKIHKSFEDKISPILNSTQSSQLTDLLNRPQTLNKVKLISKKGNIVFEKHACDNCGEVVNRPTKYSKSNFGAIFVCSKCKPLVFNKSFGNIEIQGENLIKKNIKSGGLWEKNRRKF